MFEVRLFLLGVTLTLILWVIPDKFVISKNVQLLGLLLVFSLSYLIVPYWATKSSHIGPATVLAASLLLMYYFYDFNSGDIVVHKEDKNIHIIFPILFLVYACMVYLPMNGSLSHWGDSRHHIKVTYFLLKYLGDENSRILLCAVILFVILFFLFKKRFFLWLMVLCFLWIGIDYFDHYHDDARWILRYPILYNYFNILLSFPLSAITAKALVYQEGLYRTLSFVSMIGIACVAVYRLKTKNLITKTLAGLAILTIPSLMYYSSLTYIEPLLIFFILIATLFYEDQIYDFIEKNKISTALGSLILACFLKETAFIYGLAFFLVTAFLVLFASSLTIGKKIMKLFGYSGLVFIPIVVFLFFRDVPKRSYQPHMSNLFVLENYQVLMISLWEQFGLLLPLGVIAMIFLLLRKKYVGTLICLFIITSSAAFYMLDGTYLGYSRFNLYLLPGILGLVVAALNEMKPEALKYVPALLPILIVVNLYLSPIDLLSGTRKAGWGDYIKLTSEYDVPYDEFYRWLASSDFSNVCIVGRTFPYWDDFYHKKYRLKFSKFHTLKLRGKVPEEFFYKSYNLCVYHENPHRQVNPSFKFPDGYELTKVFKRGDIRLLAYRKRI